MDFFKHFANTWQHCCQRWRNGFLETHCRDLATLLAEVEEWISGNTLHRPGTLLAKGKLRISGNTLRRPGNTLGRSGGLNFCGNTWLRPGNTVSRGITMDFCGNSALTWRHKSQGGIVRKLDQGEPESGNICRADTHCASWLKAKQWAS